MNKKGQLDILFIIVFLLAFVIAIFIMYKVVTEIGTVFVQDYPNVTTIDLAFGVFGTGQADVFFTSFNTLIIIIFIFGMIASLVLGFFSDTHPILALVAIILMVIFTVLAGFLSNVYGEVASAPELLEQSSQFGATTFFFEHLPKFMVLATALTIIITYSKIRAARSGI